MKTEYQTITVDIKDGIAVLVMNNPPVNQLSAGFSKELREAVTGGFEDPEITALILTGTGGNFIAGADITQIYKVRERDAIFPVALEMARFLTEIETGPKPVIAAINGNALGGGLETAMACHYRVAAQGVRLGQPEVQIGVIPGAGGTQRLPRLIGLPNALDMITGGKPVSAETAYSRGLVDEVAPQEKLLETSLKAVGRFLSKELDLSMRRTRNIIDRIPSAAEKQALLNYSKMTAAQKAKGYLAPFKALEAIEKGLSYDMDADIEREVGLFSDCAISDVAKNLMGIFLNTRAAGRLPRIQGIEPAKIRRVAVLGGGVMGSGILHLLLRGGFDAVLWDIDHEAVEKAVASVRKTFDYPINKKTMAPGDLDRMIQDHLITTTSLEDMEKVDLVIEAVVEDMNIKQDIWKRLEGICRPDTVFGTNTSALPVTRMASVLKDPGRMIGLHFFNPAHRMQLLEIICAQKTSDQTLAASVAFARAIKKVPIVVNDGPGFYVSRQLGGLMAGFIPLMAEGVDPLEIDKAMVDFGMPMGPAALSDLTGIDINYHVAKTFERSLGERYKVHPLTELIYGTGCYGRKTGAGYFDYSGKEPVPNPKIFAVIEDYLKKNGVSPKQMSHEEIVDLMLANAINEAAYMIQEGICDRPQDMDLAMIYGTGFPPYRGGILRYADAWGIRNVYEYLSRKEAEFGVRFKPAPLLQQMAESGDAFYRD
ncbi:MAG: 3-hydroxyacyl-CoA dehydrogenase NAD-binding domain-containing protein [Desulfobacteraceae bacterium]